MCEIIKDLQQNRVYAWEWRYVHKYDKNKVDFNHIKMIVDYVWKQEGLRYPPLVQPLPKNCKRVLGDATRTCVRFQEQTTTAIILHELAHSMTSNCDGESNCHGALFMGIYIQLLNRYLNIPYQYLVDSARENGLQVELNARPVFI